MIFYTRSSAHLANLISLPQGKVTVTYFKDNELCVEINQDVKNRHVWVVSSTVAPAENILETFFLLDALQRAGASISLLFVYFGYARQDRSFLGQPINAEVICRALQQFNLQQINTIHVHNPSIGAFLPLHNHIPFDFFSQCMEGVDIVIAPDEGASILAKLVAMQHGKPYIIIQKGRPNKDEAEIIHAEEKIVGKNVLIVDDMISTGNTVVKASEVLYKNGAKNIRVAATHGLFSADAYTKIEQSSIERVFVTNTLMQTKGSFKVGILDISAFLRALFV